MIQQQRPSSASWHALALGAFLTYASTATALEPQLQARGSLELRPCPIPGTEEQMLCGSLEVFEDRRTQRGSTLSLNIAVLPSLSAKPRPAPIFYLAGGPGGAATKAAARLVGSWMRTNWDIVLVDQRGTGESGLLQCQLPGGPDDLQGYLEEAFGRIPVYRRCKQRLREGANLRQYTTATAMDDLDDVRQAMGYGKINLYGGSYGARAALIYLRRHPGHVRAAVLRGPAPTALLNPLYHAQSAQRAIDLIFEQCAEESACAAEFPSVEQEFQTVLERLGTSPVAVTVEHPDTGAPVTVELSKAAFAEGIRLLMYSTAGARWVPYLIHLAHEGDYGPITEDVITANRSLRRSLAFGMLLSVSCAEDIPLIDPADIPRLTEGTFVGDGRVRQQMAVCEIWPTPKPSATYGDPVVSDVPVLLLTGTLDPVTPPRWGEETARHLSNSHHLVAPGGHNVGGPCVEAISLRFMKRGTMTGVRTQCVESIRLPPFQLPHP